MNSEASAQVSSLRSRYIEYGHWGKGGHTSERCWEVFLDMAAKRWKNRKKKSSGSAFVTDHSKPDEVMEEADHDCLLFSTSASRITNSWIIDSGCASHMALYRSSGCTSRITIARSTFSSYTEVSVQNVQIGTIVTAPIAAVSSRGSLYILETPKDHESTELACITSLQIWHERLSHVGILMMIYHEVVKGIEVLNIAESCPQFVGCISYAIRPRYRRKYFSIICSSGAPPIRCTWPCRSPVCRWLSSSYYVLLNFRNGQLQSETNRIALISLKIP